MSRALRVDVRCIGPHTVARDLHAPEPFCWICGQSSDYPAPAEGIRAEVVRGSLTEAKLQLANAVMEADELGLGPGESFVVDAALVRVRHHPDYHPHKEKHHDK